MNKNNKQTIRNSVLFLFIVIEIKFKLKKNLNSKNFEEKEILL